MSYIPRKWKWKPWQKTLLYYPLTSDLVDVMWNWNTGTMVGTCTFNNNTWVHVTWTSNNYIDNLSLWINNRNTFTQIITFKYDSWETIAWYQNTLATNQAFKISTWGNTKIHQEIIAWNSIIEYDTSYDTNWHVSVITGNWTDYKFYLDWNLKKTVSNSSNVNNIWNLQIWWWWIYWTWRAGNWYAKDYIVEDYARTDQQILEYCNQVLWSLS